MSEMSNTKVSNDGVNEARVYNEVLSPGWCPVVRTGPVVIKLLSEKSGRHKIIFV